MSAPRILSIAGTDPTGGAGIHADLKTIGALGGYGMAVVTCVVAQNTRGVRSVHVPPASVLADQLDAVSDDVEIDAVKLGMLHSTPLIEVVSAWLARVRPPLVVLDPVMVASSGDRLLDEEAEDAVRALCSEVDLVTPNLPELAVLTGRPRALTWPDALAQAGELARTSGATVLLKGGHLDGADSPDAIVTADSVQVVSGTRIDTPHTHGTGCSLSSAMATLGAASGDAAIDWHPHLQRAKAWLSGAIAGAAALHVGRGRGPIDHFHAQRGETAAPTWSAQAWERIAATRERIDGCRFVRLLADGTLPAETFRWYIAQDALYLSDYSRALSRASALASLPDDQAFWARGAHESLVAERDLHLTRLGGEPVADPSDVTRAYVGHLLSTGATGSYAELVAAVLPCYWLYQDIGRALAAAAHDEHPYRDWLQTYGEPAFEAATRRAIEIADAAASTAGPAERSRMDAAFDRAAHLELAFFEAPFTMADATAVAADASAGG